MGGPSRPLMKPRWLGGPIEAMGFDEIVDFLVAIFIQHLCYQLHDCRECLAGWPSPGKDPAAIRYHSGENLRTSCKFGGGDVPTDRTG
jgi:hypothetical protein